MNRKEEITEEIRTLTLELDGIENDKLWPKTGDVYWTICSDGDIDNWSYLNDITDKRRLDRALCFKTKEEATTYRDNDNLYVEIRQALKDTNGDWVADYSDLKQCKYFIKWYRECDKYLQIDWSNEQINTKYVGKSEDVFFNLIHKYGKLPVCRAFGVID